MNTAQLAQLLDQADAADQKHEYEQAIRLYTRVVEQTEGIESDPIAREIRLAALRKNGRLHRFVGDFEAALACYEQYYLDVGSGEQAVNALSLLANQLNHMGRYDEALKASQEALALTEALNYALGRATAFQNIGRTYAHLGRSEDAESSLRKALALFKQVDKKKEVARTSNWLGISLMDQGYIDKGIYAFQQALMLSDYISDVQKATILNNLGECHQFLFDMDRALTYHQQALTLMTNLQIDYLQADLTRNLGVDLWYLGELEDGLAYLQKSLTICQEIGPQDIKLQTLASLAEIELARDYIEAALKHATSLKSEAEKFKARHYQARGFYVLGLCYQYQKEVVKAEQMWHQALFLAHETNQQGLLWRIHAGLAEVVNVEALAETHYRIAAEVIDQITYPIEDETLRETFLNAPPVKAVLDKNKEW